MAVLTIKMQTRAIIDFNKKWKLFRKMPNVNYPSVDKIGSTITRLARIFAPKFKGGLEGRIHYEVRTGPKGNSLEIISDSLHGHFQEYGFIPHFVKITPYIKEWLEAHATGAPGVRPGIKGHIFVSKFTPHIRPAIEIVRPNIDKILKGGVDDFLEKNFGGIYK